MRDEGFFFVFFAEAETAFEGEAGFFAGEVVVECNELVDCLPVFEVPAKLGATKIHKPLATNSPPAARISFVRL